MTHESPPGQPSPRMPHRQRDRADDWVVAASGERYWGLNGAAGLLAHDPGRGVLLQHRAEWSHHGGTWGLPGGARHMGESALDGALRESAEEAAVPRDAIVPRAAFVLDLEVWTYTTVIGEVIRPFEPAIVDAESLALAWVPLESVEGLPLHPGFASTWTRLRSVLADRPVLLVDVANVVGARPDGWWKDRRSAADRLLDDLDRRARAGLPAQDLGIDAAIVMPRVVAVVEGAARGVGSRGTVEVVKATADGDSEIVAQAESLVAGGASVTVVSSDRGLLARLPATARSQGAGWLRSLLDS
ncbi:NUDIX domain-containing protein [Demequina sp. NBRC 110054]|uniref:NUDIX domain-containing protein n=1 Tax=Demequina sp. NBRC 110054 TaxID=1570343 RepID=UPI001F47E290|nr:NUDIX domain-containing protein [Demequina sp. NBRC 110054]